MDKREGSAEIDAAAALWAVRAETMAQDHAAEAELREWLAEDVRRLGAYTRARAMLVQARRVKALGLGFDPDRYAASHPAPGANEATPLPTRRRFLLGGSAAAAAAAAVAVGISWPAAATTYATRRGEVRLVTLNDGSSITLNTQTMVRVLFTAKERGVELVEGEALFDVAHDARRPFLVEAGDARLTAGDTSFAVSRLPAHALEVTVRDGQVELVKPGLTRPAAMLAANMRAVVDADQGIAASRVAAAEIDRRLAWQQGMLSFEDAPLAQAAAQFARYSDTAIRFDDAAIGQETITGLYAANDPRGFAHAAALSLGLNASDQPGGITLAR